MPTTVDLKRELPCYAARRDTPELVDVPDMRFLMIDGHGDPNTPVYTDAVGALYPVAYACKFASRRELGRDHVVMPLEGLWWAEDMDAFTLARDKSRWSWTMMIMIPDWVPEAMVDDAVATVRRRKAPQRIDDVRFATLSEGRCVQALHVGPYDDEAPLLHRIHTEFVPEHGLRMTGRHHEIYLGDPRRTAPDMLRTILRQPVTDA
ncbi:GyrI-like domain-containing protein [Pseudonocardia sp. ICBG1293]|uniref:GyrI-like domain-containing protein n=1 Tax=Pseudonocardia sp. ICBG1293 TaxID=2844382 RepID=UPI001CCAD81B|nr:GyrI-like domain-containing protein [Pseudonocardia sp. ICBG1293]